MPDLLVDGLEVIQVEEDQRETPVVAMSPLDLVADRLVEVPPIMEPRERISNRELVQLLELASVFDCLARRQGQLREGGEIILVQVFGGPTPEYGEGSPGRTFVGREREQRAELNGVRGAGAVAGGPVADREGTG